MHIHGNSMNANSASFFTAGSEAKAVAAQRAADVRKRLLKSAANVNGTPTDDETLLVNYWLNASHGLPPHPAEDETEYYSAASGKDSDLG